MSIEVIKRKDYTVSQYPNRDHLYSDMRQDIEYLLSEVEQLSADYTEACKDASSTSIETRQATAERCAEICKGCKYSSLAAAKIRKEYGLEVD